MKEDTYSNRELREIFREIKEDLTDIKVQTVKTNGRVSRLENWQNFIQGGMAILALLIVPILIYIATTNIK